MKQQEGCQGEVKARAERAQMKRSEESETVYEIRQRTTPRSYKQCSFAI